MTDREIIELIKDDIEYYVEYGALNADYNLIRLLEDPREYYEWFPEHFDKDISYRDIAIAISNTTDDEYEIPNWEEAYKYGFNICFEDILNDIACVWGTYKNEIIRETKVKYGDKFENAIRIALNNTVYKA